jgi:hypothetical protein
MRVPHFNPQAAQVTDYGAASIIGSRWWSAEELQATERGHFPTQPRRSSGATER